MNKYSFKLVIRFSSIVFLLVFGCVNYLHAEERVKYLSGQKNILNNKQIRLLDTHAANALSACDFIYTGAPIGNIAGDMIYKCIESADHWFYSNGYKNIGLSDKKGTLKLHVSENGHDAWDTFATDINNIKYQNSKSDKVMVKKRESRKKIEDLYDAKDLEMK